ncbi:MAG: alpha/beta fold hydrolase [Devosia sp.]|nr:alpha/beta fold hydrolase [Devosia sp.]
MSEMTDTPLLFLAGTLCDRRVFAPLCRAMGMSAPTVRLEGADSAPEMAARLLAAAPRRLALCGFSLGAIVALEMVAQAPDRIERLALLGCTARPMPESTAVARREAVKVAAREGCASYIATAWDASVPAWRADDAGLRQELEAMAADTPLESFRQQVEIAARRNDSRPRLSQIAVPTLVLCGEEDRVCPPELSREIADAVPGAQLSIVERAGHYVTLDQPDVTAEAIRDWLARPAPKFANRHREVFS